MFLQYNIVFMLARVTVSTFVCGTSLHFSYGSITLNVQNDFKPAEYINAENIIKKFIQNRGESKLLQLKLLLALKYL
jgi:hypothetical protein